MNQMNITPQDNNSSFARFALTQEEAFRPTTEDTNFSKTRKFAIGTTLTTTAFLAAIVETTISALLAVLTSPAYLFAPKRYAQITQHTADSAKTILEAASRTFRAQEKQAEAPAPKIQPTRVEKLQGLAKAYASNAIQYSKEHKLMIAVALGTATLATAVLLYYMTSAPPSNPPIPLLHKGVTHNPFLSYPDENPEMFCSKADFIPSATRAIEQVPAPFVDPAAEIPPVLPEVSPLPASPTPISTPPNVHNPFLSYPDENPEVFCPKADAIPSATSAIEQAPSVAQAKKPVLPAFPPSPTRLSPDIARSVKTSFSIYDSDSTYISSKAAARLYTEKHSTLDPLAEYKKLKTVKNYFPPFPQICERPKRITETNFYSGSVYAVATYIPLIAGFSMGFFPAYYCSELSNQRERERER